MPSVPPKPRRIQWWFRLTSEGRGTRVVYECEVDFGPAANIFVRAETDADSLLSNGSRARREGLATADTATGVMSTYAVRCIGLRPVADLASCGGELRRLGWSPPTDVSAHPIWSALLADLGHIDAVGQERGLSPLPVLRVSDGQSSGSTHAVPETSADASDGVARSEAGTGYRRQTAPRCSAKLSSESERTALAFVT